jgi:KipI family sensor histidine kinase inhibitor
MLMELDGPGSVAAARAALAAAAPRLGLVRVRPGWSSVVAETADPVDSATVHAAQLTVEHRAQLAVEHRAHNATADAPARHHDIDVTYDGADLDAVARSTDLSVAEVVDIHSRAVYEVVCLGFTRGFPYMRGLDARLELPRHANPRPLVPANSVAIASDQCGIYPAASPGGWHLLGTAHASVFDLAQRPSPALFAAGDTVRFHAQRPALRTDRAQRSV